MAHCDYICQGLASGFKNGIRASPASALVRTLSVHSSELFQTDQSPGVPAEFKLQSALAQLHEGLNGFTAQFKRLGHL